MLNNDLKEAIEYFSKSSIKFKNIRDIAILFKKLLVVFYHTNVLAESANPGLGLILDLKNCLIKAKSTINIILDKHIGFLEDEENRYIDGAFNALSKEELINIINNLRMKK